VTRAGSICPAAQNLDRLCIALVTTPAGLHKAGSLWRATVSHGSATNRPPDALTSAAWAPTAPAQAPLPSAPRRHHALHCHAACLGRAVAPRQTPKAARPAPGGRLAQPPVRPSLSCRCGGRGRSAAPRPRRAAGAAVSRPPLRALPFMEVVWVRTGQRGKGGGWLAALLITARRSGSSAGPALSYIHVTTAKRLTQGASSRPGTPAPPGPGGQGGCQTTTAPGQGRGSALPAPRGARRRPPVYICAGIESRADGRAGVSFRNDE
jgi:hypothetical protein